MNIEHTVSENNIGPPKIRTFFVAIKLLQLTLKQYWIIPVAPYKFIRLIL